MGKILQRGAKHLHTKLTIGSQLTLPYISIEINKYNFSKIGHHMRTSPKTVALGRNVLNRFALLLLLGAQSAWSATLTVSSGVDNISDPNSLRGVLLTAASGDTITFTSGLTVNLTNAMNIVQNIIFDGNGATIDGGGNSFTYTNASPLTVTGSNNFTLQNFDGASPLFSGSGLTKTGAGTLILGTDPVSSIGPVTPLITQSAGTIRSSSGTLESLSISGGNFENLSGSTLQNLVQTGGIVVLNSASQINGTLDVSGGKLVNMGDVTATAPAFNTPMFGGSAEVYGDGNFLQTMTINAPGGTLMPSRITDPLSTFTLAPGAMTTADITVSTLGSFAVVTSATGGTSSLNVVNGLGTFDFVPSAAGGLIPLAVVAVNEPGYTVTGSNTSVVLSTANGILKNGSPISAIGDVFSGATGQFTTSSQIVSYQFELDPNLKDILFRILSVGAAPNNAANGAAALSENVGFAIGANQQVQQKLADQISGAVNMNQRANNAVAANCANFLDSKGIAPNEAMVLNRLVANANLTDLRQTIQKIGQNRAISQNPNDLPSEILPGKLPALLIPGQGQHVWLQPMASVIRQKKDKHIGGFDSNSGGFIAGYNYEANKKFSVGVFAGFSGGKTHYKDNGGHTDTTNPFVGVSTSYGWCETTFLGASFTYTRAHNHHHRTMTGTTKGHGKQDQNLYSIDLNLSHLKITKNDWVFLPYLEFGYNIAHDLSYKERSSSGMAMKHKEGHSTGIKAGTGLMFSKVFAVSSGLISPQFTIGYRGRKQLTGTHYRFATTQNNTVGASSTQTGTIRKTGKNEVNLGVAVGGFINKTWQLNAGYQASVWKRYHAHDFVISVKRKI